MAKLKVFPKPQGEKQNNIENSIIALKEKVIEMSDGDEN